MNRRLVVSLAMFSLVLPLVSQAGTYSDTRDGLVVGVDMGWGWAEAQVTEGNTTLTSDWVDDLTGDLRVGFAPSDYLVYGLEIGGWSEHLGLLDESIFWFLAGGRYFPGGGGLSLRGGLGFGSIQVDYNSPAAFITKSSGGLAWSVGAGYEFRVTPTVAVGLGYDYRHVSVGEILTIDDVKTTVQSVTLGVTWYMD